MFTSQLAGIFYYFFSSNTSKITSESLALVARVTQHCSYRTLQDPIKLEKCGWGKKKKKHMRQRHEPLLHRGTEKS